jgi:hypothetical protein
MGAPVTAEVLDGTLTALVTMRESNGEHSYLLMFEGDTDSTGDTGSAVDCHEWTAPRVPLLLVSTESPQSHRSIESKDFAPVFNPQKRLIWNL